MSIVHAALFFSRNSIDSAGINGEKIKKRSCSGIKRSSLLFMENSPIRLLAKHAVFKGIEIFFRSFRKPDAEKGSFYGETLDADRGRFRPVFEYLDAFFTGVYYVKGVIF